MARDVRYRVCLEAVQATNISGKRRLKRGGEKWKVWTGDECDLTDAIEFHRRFDISPPVPEKRKGVGSYCRTLFDLSCDGGKSNLRVWRLVTAIFEPVLSNRLEVEGWDAGGRLIFRITDEGARQYARVPGCLIRSPVGMAENSRCSEDEEEFWSNAPTDESFKALMSAHLCEVRFFQQFVR
jgi:hypothetical protein